LVLPNFEITFPLKLNKNVIVTTFQNLGISKTDFPNNSAYTFLNGLMNLTVSMSFKTHLSVIISERNQRQIGGRRPMRLVMTRTSTARLIRQ
jgi:hypothetical protein